MEAPNIVSAETSSANNKAVWDAFISFVGGSTAFMLAHELKLFPLLEKEPLTLQQICDALGTDRRATDAMLAVCTSLGFLGRTGPCYALTETARAFLLESSDTYMGGLLDLAIANSAIYSMESLRIAMKTGKAQAYGGGDIFESHAAMDAQARAFTRGMHSTSMGPAQHWPRHVDLTQHEVFLDIGGGSGAHALGALRQWPHLKGIVFDLHPVCEVAQEIAAQNKLSDRMSTHSGDLWKTDFPAADIHFYSQIYHDWPEDKCRFLTKKSFDALKPGGRIIIHEILYNDDKTGPFVAAAGSIAMLLWTEGRQYSGAELAQMLADSGFTGIEVIPTFSYWSIVTAIKP